MNPRNLKRDKNLTRLWKLKPSTKLCSDFYVFDVETAHKKKDGYNYWCLQATPDKFIFGVIYGHNYTKVIHSIKEFKETLLDPRFKNKNIFAHNAQYDLNTIYGNIYDFDPEAIFNGKFITATNGNCKFADSMNVFVGLSVKAIGEMTGNKKETLGGQKYRSKGVTKEDINYCIKDCQIVWDALFGIFEFAGEIRITQASLSMCYYRRYHQPFHIDHNENTKHFWNSYYGGRTECFKLGATHSTVIDVNSMYPYHLRNGIFPNPKTLKTEIEFPVKKLKKYLEWYEGMVEATITHRPTTIGYLPCKTKEGKLIFPNGRFRGTWNFPEIRFALKAGVIKIEAIHLIVYGEKMESPFVSFVDVLNQMKTNAKITGNKIEEDRAKRFSNSLYGKFGQRINEESIYIRDIKKQFHIIQDYQRKRLFKKLIPFSGKRNDAFLIIGRRKNVAIPYAIPSFASYITTYGRIQLLEKMLAMQDKKIVYCDTDSIFFEIATGVQSENQLGGWKVEDKIITNIKGLKNYKYLDTKNREIWRVKGVPVDKGKTVKIFKGETEQEFNTVTQTSDNSFRYFNLMKSKEALRRGKEPGVLTERLKTIKNTYDKRIVFDNGETKPIVL